MTEKVFNKSEKYEDVIEIGTTFSWNEKPYYLYGKNASKGFNFKTTLGVIDLSRGFIIGEPNESCYSLVLGSISVNELIDFMDDMEGYGEILKIIATI